MGLDQGGWDAAAMGLVRFYYTKSGMGLWGKGRGCGVVLRYTFIAGIVNHACQWRHAPRRPYHPHVI